MRQGPDTATRRAGTLVLVLPVVALLTMLALSGAVTVRLRWAEADALMRRAEARDAARTRIAEALHALVADTNGVDALDEPWAATGPLTLVDAESRIHLNNATPDVLAALLTQTAGLPAGQAEALAQSIVAWRGHQPAPPTALELFGAVPGMNTDILARLAPHATVHGPGRVNVNTAGETVLRALLAGTGAPRDVQDRMVTAFRTARRAGRVCPTADPQTLAELFVGPRAIPDPATAQAIAAVAPLLGTESSAFGGLAIGTPADADHPRHAISFVYDRSARTFVRWVE